MQDTRYHIRISFETRARNADEALLMATCAIADRTGGFLEVFEEESDEPVLKGDVAEIGSVSTMSGTPVEAASAGDDHEYNVVIAHAVEAFDPGEAITLALFIIDTKRGGTVQVFEGDDRMDVLDIELKSLKKAA